MKHYISLDGVQLLSEVPENLGFTEAEYNNGALVEISEDQVELAEQMFGAPNYFKAIFPPKYYYIKAGRVVVLDKQLPDNYEVGHTYEDYQRGAFVQLSDEQVQYYLHHQDASVAVVWNMSAGEEHVVTLDEVKSSKLAELEQRDSSSAVNEFIVNGVGAWFEPSERSNYNSSIQAAETMGLSELTFYVGSVALTVSVEQAKQMLAAVQLYADQCFIVTKQHAAAISALESIEDVQDYDITAGYPDKLSFNI
jgi:hypothetical protein